MDRPKNEFDITVIVTRYGESDESVLRCLTSLSEQKDVAAKILFLDQKESDAIRSACAEYTGVHYFDYMLIPARSLSYARNFGVANSVTDLVAFCDSDCILAPDWAAEIVRTFRETGAAIVGTKIIPIWESGTSWYHRSKIIREFYSLLDLSDQIIEVKKVVGASFALDKSKVKEKIFFDENLGRQQGVLLGGEETDLCKRVRGNGSHIIYTPRTYANHVVAKERINLRWLLKRAYFGGFSRALRQGKAEPFNTEKSLRDYLAIALILPAYALGYWKGKSKHD